MPSTEVRSSISRCPPYTDQTKMNPQRDGMVFVIDDDASVRRALARLLRSVGYSYECFPSASAFLARAKATVPSCVVLDYRMPGLNGLELQNALIANPTFPSVYGGTATSVGTETMNLKTHSVLKRGLGLFKVVNGEPSPLALFQTGSTTLTDVTAP